MIILDTSGLLAALDGSQRQHAPAKAALAIGRPRVLSPFVLAELDYLIATRVGQQEQSALLREIEQGAYFLAPFSSDDVRLAREVMERYHDFDLGLADASIVVLADRFESRDILTLDGRHFRAVVGLDGQPFRVLPEDLPT